VPSIYNRLVDRGIDWAYYYGNIAVASLLSAPGPYQLDLGPNDGTGHVRRFGDALVGDVKDRLARGEGGHGRGGTRGQSEMAPRADAPRAPAARALTFSSSATAFSFSRCARSARIALAVATAAVHLKNA
jgi:hypothetical protein